MVVIVCLAFVTATRAGSDWQQKAKLIATDGDTMDGFGYSVSMSGDYCLIGSWFDNATAGSAYIFKRSDIPNDPNWYQQAKLTASDLSGSGLFGGSVALDGDYAVIGAYQTDIYTGAAYIFEKPETGWVDANETAILSASDACEVDFFGYSVSISGDHCIIGAYGNDDDGINSGSTYIFKRTGEGTWTQQAKLTASDAAMGDNLGFSVSISGNYAIVGAYVDNNKTGAAYIFERPDSNWASTTETQKLTASDGLIEDEFGRSVAISGEQVIIGAIEVDTDVNDTGAAYIFKRLSPTWSEQQIITAWDGAPADSFGRSVSISGDYAVVAVPYDEPNDAGSAFIFRRVGSIWTVQDKLTASDPNDADHFGTSVSISGHYAIVGSPEDDDNGLNSGSAYIFRQRCPTADLNGDCKVDLKDIAIVSSEWLKEWN
jgi:hypothetical protein